MVDHTPIDRGHAFPGYKLLNPDQGGNTLIHMGHRVALLATGFAGFVAGAAAASVFPLISSYLAYVPEVFTSQWFLSGAVGSLLSVVVVLAYTSVRH